MASMSRPLRIVLAGGFFANYPEGGGLWTGFLQYPLGLRALGHDAWWLELLTATGDPGLDRQRIEAFFARMTEHGLGDRCALLLMPKDTGTPDLDDVEPYRLGRPAIRELAESADLLWNFACALRPPLLTMFRHRVLVDGDPGHLHVSAIPEFAIHDHHAFLTAGTKLHDPDCAVPTLGVRWRSFLPVVHLPRWAPAPDPGPDAPFTSVTHWTWEELWVDGRVLSVSKRMAYLRYLNLPIRTGRLFELAANISAGDSTAAGASERARVTAEDRALLQRHGWRLVDPHHVAPSPAAYCGYLHRSRAEFGCVKQIHRELRTGWFSDRSAVYLASGRPVVFEDTGIGDHLPTGVGLVLFRELDDAVAAVAEIDRDYARHSRAARELAEGFLDARRCLPAMLDASSTRASGPAMDTHP
jgi:hypothetical protein